MIRTIDRLVVAAAILATGYMGVRGSHIPVNDLLPGGRLATAMYVVAAVVVVVVLSRIQSRPRVVGILGRTMAYGVALVLVVIGLSRAKTLRWQARKMAVAVWPPQASASRARRLAELSPADRASWGVHVAVHALGDSTVHALPLVLPSEWPFPDDVEVATRPTTRGTTEVWARAAGGAAACMTVPAQVTRGADSVAQQAGCATRRVAPAGLAFMRPERAPGVHDVSVQLPPAVAPWVQHRGDGSRRGIALSRGVSRKGWTTSIDGPIRASASVVGDNVLIGTHGTGVLEALDLNTGRRRWIVRVPNWIHQDAVSDGQVVVVGFGNIWESFAGRAPSGVAAYALVDGRHLWTQFDESSVMTSPVIVESTLIYSTAAGTLRKRALRTGALLAERQLPGGVIMGPPAIHGDTVAVALDEAGVCAVLASTLDRLWCRRIPGMRMLGHAAPTIANGMIIASGPGLLRAATLREFMALPAAKQFRMITHAVAPDAGYVGQNFTAYSMRDGRTLWSSPFFEATRGVDGHSAGTAAIDGDIGAILIPFADLVVGFRARTGEVVWTAPGHQGRGAPLLVDGRVVIAGRDGVIETRDAMTGELRCTTRRPVGYDRAGPAMAGNLLIFADLNGGVEAIPDAVIVGCSRTTS